MGLKTLFKQLPNGSDSYLAVLYVDHTSIYTKPVNCRVAEPNSPLQPQKGMCKTGYVKVSSVPTLLVATWVTVN